MLDTGAFQLSLFDERDPAEITAPEFPGQRLVVGRTPLLAEERWRKREDLLRATKAALTKLADKTAGGAGDHPAVPLPAPSATGQSAA